MQEFVNKFTGEIKKRDFGSPIWSPVQDFEHYEPGTSMTAPDQCEKLETIIKRCLRGELLNIKPKQEVDSENLSDAEVEMLDGYSDLADTESLVSAALAADGANSEVAKPEESAASASDSTTTESKTQSADSSESKG